DELRGDISKRECTALLGHHGMKQDLQQQVAELFAQLGVVAGANGVVDLVRLLDEVGAQRFVRLRGVPLAARAEVAHERERVVERWLGVHGTVYYPGNAQSDETRLGRHRPRRVVTQCRVDRG